MQISKIEDAILSASPAIATIKKDKGESAVHAMLVAIIVDIAKFYSVGRSMNAEQAIETARLVLKDYYYLKISDFKLFSDRMKSGKYGKTFDRMDGSIILLALAEYCEERIVVSEQVSAQKIAHIKETENQELYIVCVGNNFVRSVGEDFEEVDIRELATAYTYGVALVLKDRLIKDHFSHAPKTVVISHKNKPSEDFFNKIEKTKIELMPKGERFKRLMVEYSIKKEAIENDNTLSELEKANAIRVMSGLAKLTQSEYELQKKVYEQK